MSAAPLVEPTPGALMQSEAAEAPSVFAATASLDHSAAVGALSLSDKSAIYTVARGSSDAAANILSYEIMRETGIPTTSLPPSVFSLGDGVNLSDAAVMVISQSGASSDLVASARGAVQNGACVTAITNKPGSAIEEVAQATLPIGAGPELAVPATKSVIGSVAAGMALLAAIKPDYRARAMASAAQVGALDVKTHPRSEDLRHALLRAQHVYVIGRDTGYGAAQEIALKLKECCALHAEAYSSSEVLHSPLQLVTKPLTILMLDTEAAQTQDSMNVAQARFEQAGGTVLRVRPSDIGATDLTPAAAAAVLLHIMYPVILSAALALGFDPDRPDTLAKETLTT